MTEIIKKENDWIDDWFDNPEAEKYAMNIIIKRNQQLYGEDTKSKEIDMDKSKFYEGIKHLLNNHKDGDSYFLNLGGYKIGLVTSWDDDINPNFFNGALILMYVNKTMVAGFCLGDYWDGYYNLVTSNWVDILVDDIFDSLQKYVGVSEYVLQRMDEDIQKTMDILNQINEG